MSNKQSLYAQYILEREGKEIIEDNEGFVTFIECEDRPGIYIADVYVVPEERKTGKAHSYFDQVEEIAKERGKTFLRTSVESALPGWEISLKALMCNSFNIISKEGTFFYLERKIEDKHGK